MTASDTASLRRFAVRLAFVAAAGLLLRLLAIRSVGFDVATFDVDGYHAQAMVGLSGRPVPDEFHPPGYPWLILFFYKVFGIRPRLFYGVQAVLGSAAVVLAGHAAFRRWGERAGLLAASLLAFCGYLVVFTPALASENMALFGVAVLAWLVLPDWPRVPLPRLLAAACVVGALSLVRSSLIALSLPLALAPLLPLLARRQNLPGATGARAGAFGIGLALGIVAITPSMIVSARRATRTGVFRLGTPHDFYNLWVGNNPAATGRIDPMPEAPELGSPAVPDAETRARILAPRVKAFWKEHPLRQAWLFLKRASFNAAPPKRDLIYLYANGWSVEHPPRTIKAVYVWVVVSFAILASAVFLAFAKAGGDSALVAALAFAALGILPYQISIGDARFAMPLYPLLAVAAGALAAPRGFSQWAPGRRAASALFAVLFFANAIRDVSKTDPALRAIAREGGNRLRVPYHFAR